MGDGAKDMTYILSHWPGPTAMARDLGVNKKAAQYWIGLGYAPRWWDAPIAAAVVAKGGDITAEQVAALRPVKRT